MKFLKASSLESEALEACLLLFFINICCKLRNVLHFSMLFPYILDLYHLLEIFIFQICSG
jgi:hypothetical protein